MNIGLYFGSFNPIHHGHLIIANTIRQQSAIPIEQIWFIVSPQNPFKSAGTLLNEYHRLYLVQVATEDEPALKVSDIEFRLPRPSYTIDTLTYLTEKYPHHHFSVIIGSDSLKNIKAWKNADALLRDYQFLVYERPGFPQETDQPGRFVFLKAPLLEISSTLIRKLVRDGKSIRYLVPEKVRAEIEANGYYRNNVEL